MSAEILRRRKLDWRIVRKHTLFLRFVCLTNYEYLIVTRVLQFAIEGVLYLRQYAERGKMDLTNLREQQACYKTYFLLDK